MLIHWMALIFAFNNAAVQLLVPLYALHRGYPNLTIGVLAALPSVANITLRLTFGRLSDRRGETRVLRMGGLIYLASVSGLALSLFVGLPAFVAAQLLQGVGRSIFWTVGQTYVTKLPLLRGQHLSLFNGASNLGMLLGMTAAGVLAVSFGYPGAFAAIVVLTAVYAGLTYALPVIAPASDDGPRPREPIRFAIPGFNLGPLWPAAFCSFVTGGTMALAASFYPVYLTNLGYGAKSVGFLVMLLAAGMLGASFVSARLIGDQLRLERLALVFITATGLAFAVVPAFRHWLPLALLLLGAGFCAGGCNFVYQLAVLRHSARDTRGAAMASVGLFGNIALLVLPTAIGFSLKWVRLETALVAAGVFVMLLGGIAGRPSGATGRPGSVRHVAGGTRSAERT